MTEATDLGGEGLGDLVSAKLVLDMRAIFKARLVVAELSARVRALDPEDETDAIWDVARALGFEVEFDNPVNGFIVKITPREVTDL